MDKYSSGRKTRTVFDIRRLFESRDLDQCEAVLRKILVGHAYSLLKALLRLRELLALFIESDTALQPNK